MVFKEGNELWKLRNKHGRDYKYTPDEIWEGAQEYFVWIIDNPIEAQQNVGTKNVNDVKFKRPFTLRGVCLYLDISRDTYCDYRKINDFVEVIRKIDDIIYDQKFEGAVIGLFNANIIARDLGLKDKSDITSDDKPIALPQIYLPDNGRNPKTD